MAVPPLLRRLFAEGLDDLHEPARVDGVALAGGPEDVEVAEAEREDMADLAAEDPLVAPFVLVPGDFPSDFC